MARLHRVAVGFFAVISCCFVSVTFQLVTNSEKILDKLTKDVGNSTKEEKLVNIDIENSRSSRNIKLLGFHRNIETTVQIELIEKQRFNDNLTCHILMIDHLPSGVYVDPDQLQNRMDFGGPQVLILEEIDIEKPEYMSSGHSIISFKSFKDLSLNDTLTITFPVHLRYHRPSNDSTVNFVNVTIHPPDMVARCVSGDDDWSKVELHSVIAPCSSSKKQLCRWQNLLNKEALSINVTVPVGQYSDTVVVFFGTVLCVFASVLYTIYVLLKSSKNKVVER